LEGLTIPGAQVLSRAHIIAGQAAAIRALATSQRRETRRVEGPAWPVAAAG